MNDWTEYLKFLAAMISIANPIGAIPVFISLTSSETLKKRRQIASLTSATSGVVLIIILFAGEPILSFFGITVSSFKTAGGLIILLMAISMVHGRVSGAKHTAEEGLDAADRESVAIVPLGIPLLAGPGAMSTVIVYSHHAPTILHHLLLCSVILIVTVGIWLCLNAAPYLSRWMGKTGINVVTRIMGLILAAMGVEFIADGLLELLPGLTR